jgi:hypothetical protein
MRGQVGQGGGLAHMKGGDQLNSDGESAVPARKSGPVLTFHAWRRTAAAVCCIGIPTSPSLGRKQLQQQLLRGNSSRAHSSSRARSSSGQIQMRMNLNQSSTQLEVTWCLDSKLLVEGFIVLHAMYMCVLASCRAANSCSAQHEQQRQQQQLGSGPWPRRIGVWVGGVRSGKG